MGSIRRNMMTKMKRYMFWKPTELRNYSSAKESGQNKGVHLKEDLKDEIVTSEESSKSEIHKVRKKLHPYLRIHEPPQLPLFFCAGLMGFDQLGPLEYWRHIPKFLTSQGCKVVVTKVPPTASIEVRAHFLEERVEKLIHTLESPEGKPFQTPLFKETKKVHLIGHSMGGLDSRFYISKLEGHKRVFSLTTLSTPHRGSYIAEHLLKLFNERAPWFERILKALGIKTEAFHQLHGEYLEQIFNPNVPDHPDVQYFSYAGVMHRAPLFPLDRWMYKKLTEKEGPNDGMVSLQSAKWGKFLGEVPLSHMQQMNWGLLQDTRYLYRDIAVELARAEKEKPT